MKKILTGLLAASVMLGSLAACNSKLDVQPIDNVDAEQALNNSSDVQAALVGAYTGLQDVNAYGGNVQFFSDLLANNGEYAFLGTFAEPKEAQNKSLLKDNFTVANMWLRGYSTINRVNNVLANVGKLDTPAKQASGEGEARFIRALVYFDLVRLYAKAWNDGSPQTNLGVPLVLTPTLGISASSSVPRSTVAEVYAQIIADLTTATGPTTALTKLPATNGFFATRGAALALLARVYLQQGRFADAADAANRVITSTSPTYRLNTNYADNFVSNNDLLPNTNEDIFAIQISAQSGINQLNTFYARTRRGDIRIRPQLLAQFETGDDRRALFNSTTTNTYSSKYNVLYGGIKLIRFAEMYLIRAEGNLRSGVAQVGTNTPLVDVNVIRSRAKLPPLTAVVLADVLKERRLELAFEGFRLGDLKRNQESTIDPVSTAAIAWNSPRLVLPIPLREINANPNLVQNEGYQ